MAYVRRKTFRRTCLIALLVVDVLYAALHQVTVDKLAWKVWGWLTVDLVKTTSVLVQNLIIRVDKIPYGPSQMSKRAS